MTFNSVMESWKDDRRSGCLSALRVKYLRIIQISPDQRLPAREIMEFVGISVGECSILNLFMHSGSNKLIYSFPRSEKRVFLTFP